MNQSVEIVDIHCVMGGGDEYGRGKHPVAYYSSYSAASAGVTGVGYWGGDGTIINKKAIKITDLREHRTQYYLLESATPLDLDEIQKKADEKLRNDTLSNLSAEQKRVLNLG